MEAPTGRVFNIQRYSLYDGRGIRTLVFFKGCPLRCRWCSNPESISPARQVMLMRSLCTGCGECAARCPLGAHSLVPDGDSFAHLVDRSVECTGCGSCAARCPARALTVCGRDMTLEEVMSEVLKDEVFYMTSGGGVTLGGGEVTMQADFAARVLAECRARGIDTAIETCGFAPEETMLRLVPLVDTFLYDLKAFDDGLHRELTGRGNGRILSNLEAILGAGARVVVRMPMLKGYNDGRGMLADTAEYLGRISRGTRLDHIELLPYHKLGVGKYGEVDREYAIEGDPSLSDDEAGEIAGILGRSGLPVSVVRFRSEASVLIHQVEHRPAGAVHRGLDLGRHGLGDGLDVLHLDGNEAYRVWHELRVHLAPDLYGRGQVHVVGRRVRYDLVEVLLGEQHDRPRPVLPGLDGVDDDGVRVPVDDRQDVQAADGLLEAVHTVEVHVPYRLRDPQAHSVVAHDRAAEPHNSRPAVTCHGRLNGGCLYHPSTGLPRNIITPKGNASGVQIRVQTSQTINGKPVTRRQLEALLAVQDTGSQTAAARKLGISVPVLHKYVASIEEAVGSPVLKTTPAGSRLTEEGLEVASVARSMDNRCDRSRGFTVCCSPVTEDLLMSVVSSLRIPDANIVVSGDEYNIRMLREDRADLAIIDDPLYLFDADEFEMDEIGYMGMVMVDNGPSFIRYKYGAQRVAFMFLDSEDREYTIDSETFSLPELLGSNKSFFVDEYLLTRRNLRLKSAVDPKMLRHSITALYREETRQVSRLINALKARQL